MQEQGAIRPIRWRDGRLSLLDQTRLPAEECWIEVETVEQVAEAIEVMRVRGAPAIGIVAVAGMAIAARDARSDGVPLSTALQRAGERLSRTRPTAVNLHWGIERALREANSVSDLEVPSSLDRLVERVLTAQWTDERSLSMMGAALLPAGARIVTHCNTGPLATGGYGTALGVVRAAAELGGVKMIYADETRPRLQGARLTAWELQRLGIPFRVVPDGAAAALMASGGVDAVIVGADRIAANGDVANKIGTFQLAIAANYHRIPFYVAAPVSTIDPTTESGELIPIEQRSEDEVHFVGGERITPDGTRAVNLAFDVTPAALVTAIITERGVLRPPYSQSIVDIGTQQAATVPSSGAG